MSNSKKLQINGPAQDLETQQLNRILAFLRGNKLIDLEGTYSIEALLFNRAPLLKVFKAFDEARKKMQIEITSSSGESINPGTDPDADDILAGPCGKTVNEVKRRLYDICRRLDKKFDEYNLDKLGLREIEDKFL